MRSLFTLIMVVFLTSCATEDSTDIPSPLSSWTQESETFDFVSSLTTSGEREAFIGDVKQGVYVYFYDSEVDCSDPDIFEISFYDGAVVEIFYPISDDTFSAPLSVTFRSPDLGQGNEVSTQYSGELEIKEVDNEELLSGWVRIEGAGFDEDSSIVGSFESTKCY